MTDTTDPTLEHASRQILKATLVPLTVDAAADGQATVNHTYIRQLALQPGEVAAVKTAMTSGPPPHAAAGVAGAAERAEPAGAEFARGAGATEAAAATPASTAPPIPWDLLSRFDSAQVPSQLPAAVDFAGIPGAALRAFGAGVANLRASNLAAATQPGSSSAGTAGADRMLLNRAVVANRGFDLNTGVSGSAFAAAAVPVCPLGMLNLERLEMTPAGIERGELVGTIPLAPGEETSVTQTEWSVTSKEFTSIVTDSLENVSETGVTDNTELAQSTSSQLQHANQFNVTATVHGGIDLISGSASSGFSAQDSGSQSAADSRKHAVATTQKASSRTKKEHKVTISTTTATGTSETTTRTLKNSSGDPIRIDYFSMMRKWRVRLYRYGLRMTYDLVVPEPAGAMRAAYAELADIKRKIGPFVFTVPRSEITDTVWAGETEPHFRVLADRYGAQVPDPPQRDTETFPAVDVPVGGGIHNFLMPLPVKDTQEIVSITFNGRVTGPAHVGYGFLIIGSTFGAPDAQPDTTYPPTLLISNSGGNYLAGAVGAQVVPIYTIDASSALVQLTVETKPSAAGYAEWQEAVWDALYNAAQTQYYAEQQDLAARAADLQDRLDHVDTLTLRREEGDEVMKSVLRWFTSGFDIMPADVVRAFKDSGHDLSHGVGFTGTGNWDTGLDQGILGISQDDWAAVAAHEDVVRFINQAIEWENVVTFLYSYFWDIPESWDFIRQIEHPDPTRQAFLRSGSARVVLTIRKGWEAAWIGFVATGGITGSVPDHPYLPIANEIAAYDDRNYPGIPPANPGKSSTMLQDAVAAACSVKVTPPPSGAPVIIPVDDSDGFLVGAKVVVDTVAAGAANLQESGTVTEVHPNRLVVSGLTHVHDGTVTPFPVVQPGEKGALIAEWAEYTPTSGTDIAVTSNLTQIA